MMHWGGDYGMGYGFSPIFMIFFWVLIVLGAVYLIKALLGGRNTEEEIESARDILEKRFARGEISEQEFEVAMETLKRSDKE